MGIDYFTKWVEELPLTNADQDTMIDFIHIHIIYRYGIDETITSDQGSVFVDRKVTEFSAETGIKFLTLTPYYTQANNQVEAANKVIISLIRKHICQNPRSWYKTLNQALWASRTSPKEATNSTPFRLAFGHNAILPAKICVQYVRTQR